MTTSETSISGSPEQQRRLKRIRRLAQLLDNAFRIPGTGMQFGWDSIIGLIPGGGDVATGLLSGYIVLEAKRLGIPQSKLRRMIVNVAVDLGVGAIPLAGDVFDFAFKANRKNLKLIEEHIAAELQRDTGS